MLWVLQVPGSFFYLFYFNRKRSRGRHRSSCDFAGSRGNCCWLAYRSDFVFLSNCRFCCLQYSLLPFLLFFSFRSFLILNLQSFSFLFNLVFFDVGFGGIDQPLHQKLDFFLHHHALFNLFLLKLHELLDIIGLDNELPILEEAKRSDILLEANPFLLNVFVQVTHAD